ncbi:M48 family metallopeptidase [Faecalimonas umbilicata]|uniref:M48 family metallopeptidase n=1 Tax=Faecalimonas umbilicata TaxID=1912855 RepID=UPI0039951A68
MPVSWASPTVVSPSGNRKPAGKLSSAGNLNYNWRLIFAPEEIVDYIVVHELAHRLEMNHSKAFYNIVESVLPDYRKAQKWLRENGGSL